MQRDAQMATGLLWHFHCWFERRIVHMTSLGREKTLTVNDDVSKESPKIVSRFQLAVLAGLRSRQLFNGARPRIVVDGQKRKNTGIALEEVSLGLIAFSMIVAAEGKKPGG